MLHAPSSGVPNLGGVSSICKSLQFCLLTQRCGRTLQDTGKGRFCRSSLKVLSSRAHSAHTLKPPKHFRKIPELSPRWLPVVSIVGVTLWALWGPKYINSLTKTGTKMETTGKNTDTQIEHPGPRSLQALNRLQWFLSAPPTEAVKAGLYLMIIVAKYSLSMCPFRPMFSWYLWAATVVRSCPSRRWVAVQRPCPLQLVTSRGFKAKVKGSGFRAQRFTWSMVAFNRILFGYREP